MNSATDGSAVTSGTPTVYYTVDGGTQGTGAGTSTHEGNGQWSYAPAQAETNGDHVAFTMVLTNAISQTVNVWPVSFDPTDSVRMGITALPNAAADAAGGLPISDAGGLDMDSIKTDTAAILTDTGTDGVLLASTATSAQLVDDVWDEALTGATHNVTNSAGKRLRAIDAAFEVHSGTAQAGAAGTITLDTGASATDDIYRGDRIVIVGGTGAQEHGICISYNGTTKVATMSENWVITPDATSEFEVVPADVDIETWAHKVVTASASGLPDVNVNEVGDTAQTAGDLAALITTVDTVVDGIQTDLDNGTDGLGAIKTDTAAILTDTAEIGAAGAGLTDLGGMSTAMKAEVNAEMLDILQTDTFAELASVPAATSSLKDKITFLFMLARNQVEQTSTTQTLRADDTTTAVSTATVSDNGTTATRGEHT